MYRPKFVLDDFTDSLYASKSTIAFGDTCEENCVNLLRSMEYVDPRGGINIGNKRNGSWLFIGELSAVGGGKCIDKIKLRERL